MIAKQLLVATHNKGKVSEFADMLQELKMQWLSLADVNVTEDVEETGVTFRENAVLKAKAYAQMTGLLTLADDSGLEVDALNGDPGVYTARYGGDGLSHEDRYRLLLRNLEGVPEEERTARFRCVIVLADENGRLLAESEGVCAGRIAFQPVGEGGFGYDPVFFVPEKGKTMAQLPASVKHQISHRGQALQAITPQLLSLLRA